ncbi:MAG: hypothetical protein V1784_01470, partial [bacterium]
GDLRTSADIAFIFKQDSYVCSERYLGPVQFGKHLYDLIDDMNPEEAKCAEFLDQLPEVECWVRNPVRYGFSLPTSTDKFYPDFICRLKDSRYLVVEYKNEKDWSNDDSKEKRMVGEAWERASEGQCLFIMPLGMANDLNEIRAKVSQGLTGVTTGGQIEIR